MQKSPEAFTIAQGLMRQESKNCKFFGALTYSVVIANLQEDGIADKIGVLLEEMEGNVVALAMEGGTPGDLVIKKLFSNMSFLFTKYWNIYPNPLVSLHRIILNLPENFGNDVRVAFFLTFASILVEDISKQERNPDLHKVFHNDVYPELEKSLGLILSNTMSFDDHLLTLEFIDSWVDYVAGAENASAERYETNDLIADYIFHHFVTACENFNENSITLCDKAAQVMTEILEIYPRLLSPEKRNTLETMLFAPEQWGQLYVSTVLTGSSGESFMEETEHFANLVTTLLLSRLEALAKLILVSETQSKVEGLIYLTNFPGIPIEEETVSDRLLTFWEDLVNVFKDQVNVEEQYADDMHAKNQYLEIRDDIINRVCLIYWYKIRPPDSSTSNIDRSAFAYYRTNVADLFITTYSLLGVPFYNTLCENVIQTLGQANTNLSKIGEIEVSLYLLYKITEDVVFFESQAIALMPSINSVFEAGLLRFMQSLPTEIDPSLHLLPTLISFLTSVQVYLRTDVGSQYLSDVLNILFTIIILGSPQISLAASKSILLLCQDCRDQLIEFLPQLEVLLKEIMSDMKIDSLIRQRMFNSFISIAVGLRDAQKLGQVILNLVLGIHESSMKIMSKENLEEEEEDYLVSLLSSVLEMGNACGNLENVEETLTDDDKQNILIYWTNDPLKVKESILSLIEKYSFGFAPFLFNTVITEKCCLTLKCGIREPLEGPFKFSLKTLFDYASQKTRKCDLNSLSYIYRLVETVVIVNFRILTADIMEQLLNSIYVERIEIIREDMYAVNAAMELFATTLEKKPALIIYTTIFRETILLHALGNMSNHEAFIIKSVGRFWNALLTLRRAPKETQDYMKELMINTNLGVEFTQTLCESFINATRSTLDNFYITFRNLISKYPLEAKKWLLISFAFINNEKTKKEVDILISSLLLTRGQSSANVILKKIWLQANGLVDYNDRKY